MDNGIKEKDFWVMTFAEIERAIDSNVRVEKQREKEKAVNDYILADLIGKSIARIYSATNKMPSIEEAYPTLFDASNKQAQQDNISAIRFRQFAESYNKRWAKK